MDVCLWAGAFLYLVKHLGVKWLDPDCFKELPGGFPEWLHHFTLSLLALGVVSVFNRSHSDGCAGGAH